MTDAIQLAGVTRRFRGATALDEVSLTIPTGSICGLLGRNGAGKTTLMSIISGQDRADTGTVRVLGEEPFECERVLSQLSFVRDNQRYPDGYRLRHVLRIAPDFAPHWSGDLATELVESLRIPATTPIRKLSRGQLSAVAIVLGLASRAPITLLDEPYLGLDVTARALFHRVLLRDVTEHPRTILLSTHLIEESEALFDRVVILERGRVQVDSAAEELAELAVTITGTTSAVTTLTDGHRVLTRHTTGGLSTATIGGQLDAAARDEAARLGARLAPASLQDLVVAYGDSEHTDSILEQEAQR
ncbi:MAG TPA: ABC transporter ATP-binding protein [Microbacteriaceae bacterium]|nr:ABC transporter ATP-binding protein [Microbacteriaceae bacterium]